MSQPKIPPISVRLPADLVAEVEAWAVETGRKRNGAIAELLRRGLAASGPSLPAPEVQAQIKAAAMERQARAAAKPAVAAATSAFPRPAYGSRLKKPK